MNEVAARLRAGDGSDAAITFGAAALAIAAFVAVARMEDAWAAFPLLLLVAVPCVILLGLALAPDRFAVAPDREDLLSGRWRAAVLVAGLFLLAASLGQLVRVLGDDDPGSASATWISLVVGVAALVWASRFESPGLQLVGMLWLAVAVLAFVDWVNDDATEVAFRNVLLAIGVAFLLVARIMRPTRLERSHVVVAAAAGLLIAGAVIGAYGDVGIGYFIGIGPVGEPPGEKDGWEMVLLLTSLGALAYTGWQRYRGTVYPAFAGLAVFLAVTAGGSLAGWPLILLFVGLGCLAWGLFGTAPRRQGPAVSGSGAPSSETSGAS
jgi:hypothetical protein